MRQRDSGTSGAEPQSQPAVASSLHATLSGIRFMRHCVQVLIWLSKLCAKYPQLTKGQGECGKRGRRGHGSWLRREETREQGTGDKRQTIRARVDRPQQYGEMHIPIAYTHCNGSSRTQRNYIDNSAHSSSRHPIFTSVCAFYSTAL